MLFTSAVIGSALAVTVFLAVVLTAVIWAVLSVAAVVLVASVDAVEVWTVVVACWLVVVSAVVPSAVEIDDDAVAVDLPVVRSDRASARVDVAVPDAVDELLAVLSAAADDDVDVVVLGPRALCPVAFFADPEFDVAELDESEVDPWLVSSALATATTGLARDNPSAKAAIPARAPR